MRRLVVNSDIGETDVAKASWKRQAATQKTVSEGRNSTLPLIADWPERGCVRGAPAAAVESFRDSGSPDERMKFHGLGLVERAAAGTAALRVSNGRHPIMRVSLKKPEAGCPASGFESTAALREHRHFCGGHKPPLQ
jgi:hypothetical protein